MLATGYYKILYGQAPLMAHGVAQHMPFLAGPTLPMAVTPVTGEDLKKLAEGYLATDLRRVYVSGVAFHLADAKTLKEPDRIVISGRQFAVVHVDDWNESGNFQMLIVEEADAREDLVHRGAGGTVAAGPVTSVGVGTG